MQVPRLFYLDKRPYEVFVQPHVSPPVNGVFYAEHRVIHIEQHKRSARQQADTFWHEAVHAILHDMGHRLWRNEAFVEDFSRRLSQLVHTAKL